MGGFSISQFGRRPASQPLITLIAEKPAMTDREARMECLRMATAKLNLNASLAVPIQMKSDVELAREYFSFVWSGPPPAGPTFSGLSAQGNLGGVGIGGQGIGTAS